MMNSGRWRRLLLSAGILVAVSCGPQPASFVGMDYAAVCSRLGPPFKMVGDPAVKASCCFFKPLSAKGAGLHANAIFEKGVCILFEGTLDGKRLH